MAAQVGQLGDVAAPVGDPVAAPTQVNWKRWAVSMIVPAAFAITYIALGVLSANPLMIISGAAILGVCGVAHYHWLRMHNNSNHATFLSFSFGVVGSGLIVDTITSVALGILPAAIISPVLLGAMIGLNTWLLSRRS